MDVLHTIDLRTWNEPVSAPQQRKVTETLEKGHILFLPELAFKLDIYEQPFLSDAYISPKVKNISFNINKDKISGANLHPAEKNRVQAMMKRFCEHSLQLLKTLLPNYQNDLIIGRTSFRPVEITHRKTSYRKDDKRLHVDAFPSSPNQGRRILRVFSNINPHNAARVWRVGEPFEQVAQQFLPKLRRPFPGSLKLMHRFKMIKSRRTLYDHYMLLMHNAMKANAHYQKNAQQQTIHFPPKSTWIVFTDVTSHAAMQGQYLLEQTFYLPVAAMLDENQSPLRILEKIKGRPLT